MVSPISSINQYSPNREVLEVVRRLQSLGLSPTGNLGIDRQRLQTAEIKKKQATLATNSEPSLNKLQGTENDFSSTFSTVQNINGSGIQNNQNGLMAISDLKPEQALSKNAEQYNMVGTLYIAELNKYRLGLSA